MIESARFFLLAAFTLSLACCDRGAQPPPQPIPEEAPVEEEPKPAAQVETEPPALTEAAIESLILDALSPTGDDPVASADPGKFTLHNLPEAQRKTLNEAVQKAVSKIDFKTLLSSIVSNLEVGGLDLSPLPDNMSVNTRVLTPEEARKMGINIGELTRQAGEPGTEGVETTLPGNVSVSNVQIIAVGDIINHPETAAESEAEISSGDGASKTGVTTEINVTEVAPIAITEESDPERTARFQSLLQSGDSDALAAEIADLIQTGIDTAILQQAMEGAAPSAP